MKVDKLTPKQRKFAELLSQGLGRSEAYRRAYDWQGNDRALSVEATRLAARPSITLEVERLQGPAKIACQITIERLTWNLLHDREAALKLGQTGAAVSADVALAKLHGLFKQAENPMPPVTFEFIGWDRDDFPATTAQKAPQLERAPGIPHEPLD